MLLISLLHFAIFCLLTRTFAIYGIDSLKPALAYVVTVIIALFVYLFVAYPIYLMTMARVNSKPFMKKAAKLPYLDFQHHHLQPTSIK